MSASALSALRPTPQLLFRHTSPSFKASKGKSKSSTKWLSRQNRDPYIKLRNTSLATAAPGGAASATISNAKGIGPRLDNEPGPSASGGIPSFAFRSRSAFKLLEIDDQVGGFLTKPDVGVIVDLGAAPGGWSQVVAYKWGYLQDDAETGAMGDVRERKRDGRVEKERRGRKGKRVGRAAEGREQGEEGYTRREDGIEEEQPEEEPEDLDEIQRYDRRNHRAIERALRAARKAPPPGGDELGEYDPLNIEEELSFLTGSGPASRSPTQSRLPDGPLVLAVDLLPMNPIPGVHSIQGDFLRLQKADQSEFYDEHADTNTLPIPSAQPKISDLLPLSAGVDVILSDMAANSTGNKSRDVQSSLDICHSVLEFAQRRLKTADEIGRKRGGVLL